MSLDLLVQFDEVAHPLDPFIDTANVATRFLLVEVNVAVGLADLILFIFVHVCEHDCRLVGLPRLRVDPDLDCSFVLMLVFVVHQVSALVQHKESDLVVSPFISLDEVAFYNYLVTIERRLLMNGCSLSPRVHQVFVQFLIFFDIQFFEPSKHEILDASVVGTRNRLEVYLGEERVLLHNCQRLEIAS